MESKTKKSERKCRRHGRRNAKDDVKSLTVPTNFNLFALPEDHCLKLIDIDCEDNGDFLNTIPERDDIRDENMLLKKQLTEREQEIKLLQMKCSETSQNSVNLPCDMAAVKIVELSRKIRDMSAELESEKTKNKQLHRTVRGLEIQVSAEASSASLNSLQPEKNVKIKEKQNLSQPRLTEVKNDLTIDLREKLNSSQTRLAEYRNTCQMLKKDLKIAHRVLLQEVGDGATVQSAISGTGWRGRAQQILHLQNKLADLKEEYLQKKGNLDKINELDEIKFKPVDKNISLLANGEVKTVDKSCSAANVDDVQTADKSISVATVSNVQTVDKSISVATVAAVETVDKSSSVPVVEPVQTVDKSSSVASADAFKIVEKKNISCASVDAVKAAEKKNVSSISINIMKIAEKRNSASASFDAIKLADRPNNLSAVVLDVRHKEDIKKLEKVRKEESEKCLIEAKLMEEEKQHLKEKWLASKSRIQILNNENKQYKVRISALMSKGAHDDELIKAFTDQMSVLQRKTKQLKSLHETDLDVNELKKEYEEEVDKLRNIIRDREERIVDLQEEVKTIKNSLTRHSDSSTSSQGSNSAPAKRSSSSIIVRGVVSTEIPIESRNGMLPELGEIDSDIEELHIMCHEYRTVARAAQVEKDKLLELVTVLNKRVEEATERAVAAEEHVLDIQLKNVQLEKQAEMANLEASGKNNSKRHASFRPTKDLTPTIEELKSTIQLVKDEKEVLKAALHNILQAKEDDLNVYQGIICHAQEIFTKGLREHKER